MMHLLSVKSLGSRRRLLWSCLLLAASVAFGCAFGNRNVELGYPPAPDKSNGTSEAMASEAPADDMSGLYLSILGFRDLRSNPLEIGCVRNGFGMKTAQVLTDSDVGDWVTDAAVYEFEQRGFEVVKVTQLSEVRQGPVLSGDIVRVYCDAYMSYNGEVILSIKLNDGDEELYQKQYNGLGSAGTNWAAGSKAYGRSLELALGDALGAMVDDISAAMKSTQ